jgi:hypothetical protein
MGINAKVIRIREMVAGEKRTPRRMALTDFPRNWDVAKEVTDWNSALDFLDKYKDRAKEWWNQLLDRLKHDDYDKPAGLIDKALGAIPLPASRRIHRADVDRSKISEVRRAVKKEFPNLRFNIREVGFSDLARGSRYFFSASNWDSPETFKRVEEIVKSIAPEIIVSEGGVMMGPEPASRRERHQKRREIVMEGKSGMILRRGLEEGEEELATVEYDDVFDDKTSEVYSRIESECTEAADKVQEAIVEAINEMEESLVDIVEGVIDEMETALDRKLTEDEKGEVREKLADDYRDVASQFSTAEYDFHSSVAYWNPRR